MGNQIGEAPLNEMPVPKLKDFRLAFNRGFPLEGGHVVCMPNRTRSNMIKGGSIPHQLPKDQQKPPEEQKNIKL